MLKTFTTIISYISFLNKKNKEWCKQENCIYRILQVVKGANGMPVLHIQVINKNTVFACSPQQIVCDDNFLCSFSKSDIRAIVYLATELMHKPKYKVLSKVFPYLTEKMKLKILDISTQKTTEIPVSEISPNSEIFQGLSKKELYETGYAKCLDDLSYEPEELLKENGA